MYVYTRKSFQMGLSPDGGVGKGYIPMPTMLKKYRFLQQVEKSPKISISQNKCPQRDIEQRRSSRLFSYPIYRGPCPCPYPFVLGTNIPDPEELTATSTAAETRGCKPAIPSTLRTSRVTRRDIRTFIVSIILFNTQSL